jgi:hypothetical protein
MFGQQLTSLGKTPVWSVFGRLSRQTGRRSLWGDGLVDHSLSTMWYPTTWDDVSDDELVIFQPSLAFSRTAIGGQLSERGRRFIRGTLCRRTAYVADAIATMLGDAQTSQASVGDCDVLNLIARSGALTTLPLNEALREGRASGQHHGMPRNRSKLSSGAFLVAELTVLACLDRVHADACGIDGGHDAAISFEQALLASIHTQFNAAYLYPHYDWGHESFAAGAWLGTLMTGRAALMPPFIAETLLDVCSAAARGGVPAPDSTRIFVHHIDMAGGTRRLAKIARRVAATGVSAVVPAPVRRPRKELDGGLTWNEPMRDAILRRLSSDPRLERARAQ